MREALRGWLHAQIAKHLDAQAAATARLAVHLRVTNEPAYELLALQQTRMLPSPAR